MVNDLLVVRRLEGKGPCCDHLCQQFGVMGHFDAELPVFLLEGVHAVRRQGQDLLHPILFESSGIPLLKVFEKARLSHPSYFVAAASFLRPQNTDLHAALV